MLQEEIYKFIGLAIIIACFVYILARCLNYQTAIIEGLMNPTTSNANTDKYANLDQLVKSNSNNVSDQLLIGKYKTQFEDVIMELDKNTDLQLLKLITQYGSALDSNDDKNMDVYLDKIGKLEKLKSTLTSSMIFLDKNTF